MVWDEAWQPQECPWALTCPAPTPGKVEVINARETVPANHVPHLLDQCEQAQPLGTGEALGGATGSHPHQATGAD